MAQNDRPLGRGYHAESNSEWRIESWTGPRGLNDWRNIEENRITRTQVEDADQLVISVTDSEGNTQYRTFRGPIDYDDVHDIIEHWIESGSL